METLNVLTQSSRVNLIVKFYTDIGITNMLNVQINLSPIVQQLMLEKNLNASLMYKLAQQALEEKTALLALLLHKHLLNDIDISHAFAQLYQFPVMDIQVEHSVRSLLSIEQLLDLQLLPLRQQMNHLSVALADPDKLDRLEEIRTQTGLNPTPVIVPYSQLQHYFVQRKQEQKLKRDRGGLRIAPDTYQQPYLLNIEVLKRFEQESDAISQFVHYMLKHAIQYQVSDIHIESYENIFRIRYRMDGILTVVATPPKKIATQLISRLKVLARLNSSERRIPQDGNIHFLYKNSRKKMDFRMNTLPTLYGEKVVLRLLDAANVQISIDQLGFTEQQKATYLQALKKPEGMILVTGPTGSGKTVTLYSGLSILNQPERNIATVEDPIEIQLAGINQVNINPKVGLNFATALKAFLRQDPDVIMLGEIRDMETAEIALKAAQTGHLVLSTLHTNSAPETLTRLANIGIPAFNIASSVSLVIAQRLVRRLCTCKQETHIDSEALLYHGFHKTEVETLKVYQAVGCSQCSKGYKGRVGIYQVMPISDAMRQIIMSGGNALNLEQQAHREAILNLHEAGLNKVREGITSIEEIDRVTHT